MKHLQLKAEGIFFFAPSNTMALTCGNSGFFVFLCIKCLNRLLIFARCLLKWKELFSCNSPTCNRSQVNCVTSPCILELQYYPQKNDALRQYSQHRTAALLLAKHADYNSLDTKKKLQASRCFSSIQWETKRKKHNQLGEVEGKGEMKYGESSWFPCD